jgi:carboxypeptidase D
MVGFDVPHVAHDMILRFMGVDFNMISEGTVARIESSLGQEEREPILPGGGHPGDLEKAKWEGEYTFDVWFVY